MKVVTWLAFLGTVVAVLFGAPSGARAALPEFDKALLGLSASFDKDTVARGQTATLRIQIELAPGFHTYPTRQTDEKAASLVDKFLFPPSEDVIYVGGLTDPPYNAFPDLKAGIADLHTIENKAEWRQTVVISPKSTPGQKKIKVVVSQNSPRP
jgi:hypothetical protein